MSLLDTDDQLTIVNRSFQYRISKKLIRKIPYFEKMLSHGLKESKENKVELDFDVKALKSFFNWIESECILNQMDCVINLCNIVDYFGINDCLMDQCVNYFHNNFTIEHLPVIIPQVTSTSKLINSDTLNAFICRYFTKIVNSTVWLDYPIETIEYICALDLMITSEYQVFDAIMRWVTFVADSRKCYIEQLLKLVRLCHLEDKDLSKMKENELVKSSNFELGSCPYGSSDCNHAVDRTKQGHFVLIEELGDKNLRVKVLDINFRPLINLVIQSDELMSLHVLHDEYVSDISFDSGRKMIRIDWKQAKYRLLDLTAYKLFYSKIHRCVFEDQENKCCSVETCGGEYVNYYEGSLLEAVEKFTLVRYGPCNFKCWKNPSISEINSDFISYEPTYLATILDNNIYVLTSGLVFFQFNINRNLEFKKIGLQKFEGKLQFYNLLLTSKQANDDRVLLIDKTTKDVFCFNVNTQKWSSTGRITDCKSKSSDGQKETNVFKTFAFGFISMDSIKLCLKRNLNTMK